MEEKDPKVLKDLGVNPPLVSSTIDATR